MRVFPRKPSVKRIERLGATAITAKKFKRSLTEIRYGKPKGVVCYKCLHDGELLGLLLGRIAGNLGDNHENASVHLKG